MGATATERQRTYASGCRFRFPGGVIELTVDAVPVRRKGTTTDKGGFKSVCPECKGAVSQQYVCENEHGPFQMGDLAKSFIEAPATTVTVAEQEALKGDLEAGVMDLVPTKLSEVMDTCRPDSAAYRLRPGKK